MLKPTTPVSNYYERALSKMLQTGRRPAYPTGAYCLFSAHRRRQLLKANPKLLQKQAFEAIQKEWKTSDLREDFQEIARRDYKDFKRLSDFWGALQEVNYQGSKLHEAQVAFLQEEKQDEPALPRQSSPKAYTSPHISESRSKRLCHGQQSNDEQTMATPKLLTPQSQSHANGLSSQIFNGPAIERLAKEKITPEAAGEAFEEGESSSSRSIWTSSDESEDQEFIFRNKNPISNHQQKSALGGSSSFGGDAFTGSGSSPDKTLLTAHLEEQHRFGNRPSEENLNPTKLQGPAWPAMLKRRESEIKTATSMTQLFGCKKSSTDKIQDESLCRSSANADGGRGRGSW